MEGPSEVNSTDKASSPTQPRRPPQHSRPKSQSVAGAEKTFKACRTCRRQKMRCEGQVPCTRCKASGVECIFDQIGAKRTSQDKDSQGGKNKKKRLDDLESEVLQLRDQLATHASGVVNAVGPAQKDSDRRSYPERPATRASSSSATPARRDDDPASDPFGLTPDDLQAPVTAVHAMTPDKAQQHDSEQGCSTDLANFLPPVSKTRDVVSEGLVNEAQARGLFNLFMAGSNCFVPMFDPVLDTFESVRAEDKAHSSGNLREICQNEARRLAAETLFIGVPRLEDVQAMILLAAFSDRTWFAIGHATQMALVLGLQHALPQVLKRINSNESKTRKEDKILIRNARTWLAVFHIEWEIAAGTARRPRLEKIDRTTLRLFSTHSLSRPLDLRILAIAEIVELRGRLQKEIEDSEDLLETAMSKIHQISGQFYAWWTFWDKSHEEHDYHQSSFQRTSLILQKDYATIFSCCAALRKIQTLSSKGASPNLEAQSLNSTASEILTYVLNIIVDQLSFLLQSTAYRWHLKWAPTYSALTIAFTTFALKVSRLKPDLIDQSRLCSLAEEVAKVLQTHPHENFYRLIHLLLALPRDTSNFPEKIVEGGLNNLGDGIVVHPFERFKAFSFNKLSNGRNGQMQSQDLAAFQNPDIYVPENNMSTSSEAEKRGDSVARLGEPFNTQQQQFKVGEWDWSSLEPSWIFDTSSIGSFGLPNQGNASIFDFDQPLIMENDTFGLPPNPTI